MNKHSQDGTVDQQGSPPGTAAGPNSSMNNSGNAQNQASAAKSGLLTRWKTGQLPHPVSQGSVQTGNLTNEPATDPLSKRQMPRPPSQHGLPSSQARPVANPFSIPADEMPTAYQPAVPDMPRPSQAGLGQYPAVPPGQPGFPSGTGHPAPSNHGFSGSTLAPNRPHITRDLSNYPQRSNTGQLGNQPMSQPGFGSGQYSRPGLTNGQGFGSGQWNNPAALNNSGIRNPPPGFAAPPYATPGGAKRGLNGLNGLNGLRHIPIWARVVIGIMAFLIITGGSAFAYYQINFANSVNDITGNTALHDLGGKNQPAPQPVNVDPLTQRTNIVLLGSDTDGKGNDIATGTPLAQTVIIVTIDPKTNYVGMLSIPRDMQVSDLTLGGQAKIDQVFEHGWQGSTTKEKAQRAAGHTMDVIEQNYGIHIDHYAWVGLQGFIKVIDTIGGVDVDASRPIYDDSYPDDTGNSTDKYGYKRLDIAPGPQHFTGLQALEYVRTRHADLGGDFGRTERQQQVLSQIKVKLSGTDIVTKAPAILKDLDNSLLTDLTVPQLATFAQLAKNVDINKVERVSFTQGYASPITTNNLGNFAPNCTAIIPKIREMFGIANPTCLYQGSIQNNPGNSIAKTQPQPTVTTNSAIASAAGASSNSTGSGYQLASLNTGTATISNKTTFGNLMDLMLLTVSGSFTAMGK